jgi:hypothetical protein
MRGEGAPEQGRPLVDAWRLGLCASCAHHREVLSGRGPRYHLCELSKVDPAFERYPRLPVVRCGGYVVFREGDGG